MNQIQSLMRCFEFLNDKYMKNVVDAPSNIKMISSAKNVRNGTPREWSTKQLDKIVHLRQQGKSLDRIAAVMDASGPTIRRALTSRNIS